jgi:hypothetical protein
VLHACNPHPDDPAAHISRRWLSQRQECFFKRVKRAQVGLQGLENQKAAARFGAAAAVLIENDQRCTAAI